MDLDLGNSEVLRKFLLPEAMWTGDNYAVPIAAIGLGVAKSFDQYCNRKFKRSTAHIDQFTGDRDHWYLGATPVESITSFQTKSDETVGWETQTGAWTNLQTDSGRLWFGGSQWNEEYLVRVNYTGGYWYDATDTQTDTIPANATALPKDIELAWKIQCQHLWNMRDKIGVALSSGPGEASKLNDYDLIPDVRRILNAYVRYQIS
jgi:hypothetical protein